MKHNLLTFQEVMNCLKLCGDAAEELYFIIDDPNGKEYEEKLRLGGRIQKVINSYENATTAKEQYKSGSELCRLVDRISDGTAVVQDIRNGDKRYIAYIRRDGEYRIPELQIIEGSRTPTDQELNDALDRALFLGTEEALVKAYYSVIKYYQDFHKGVNK